jgi:prevent-host-death family protein
MKYLNVQEVNPSLAAIVNEVSVTQSEIVITRNGTPIARIVPCVFSRIKHYPLMGMPIKIAEDFDEPMTDLWELRTKLKLTS